MITQFHCYSCPCVFEHEIPEFKDMTEYEIGFEDLVPCPSCGRVNLVQFRFMPLWSSVRPSTQQLMEFKKEKQP